MNQIPRGLEVLIKKASVDAEFKQLLLEKREAAAEAIGLELTQAEVLLLRAIPAEQLGKTIAATTVPEEHRRAFLGKAAAAMMGALTGTIAGCGGRPAPTGIRPDFPIHKNQTGEPEIKKTPKDKGQDKEGPADPPAKK